VPCLLKQIANKQSKACGYLNQVVVEFDIEFVVDEAFLLNSVLV